jgi:hypothetical protein
VPNVRFTNAHKNIIIDKDREIEQLLKQIKAMGAYRLALYFKWQLGLCINIEDDFINISLPMLLIMINIGSDAYGVRFFNWVK